MQIQRYFSNITDRLDDNLAICKTRIDELECAIANNPSDNEVSTDTLVEVLKNLHISFLLLTRRAEKLRHAVTYRLKEAAQFRKRFFEDDTLTAYMNTQSAKNATEDYELPSLEQMASEILTPVSSLSQM